MNEIKKLTSTIKHCRKMYGETTTNDAIFSIGANFISFDEFEAFCEMLPAKYENEHGDGEDFLEYLQCYDAAWITIAYEYVLHWITTNKESE